MTAIQLLKWMLDRVDSLGNAIYQDAKRHGEDHRCDLPSTSEYHELRADLSGELEYRLQNEAGEEYRDVPLCDNSTDSPPCHNLADPKDESKDPLCPRCRAAKDKGLSYKEMLKQEKGAAKQEREAKRLAARNKAIYDADPKLADFIKDHKSVRKLYLDRLRKETEELEQG